MLMDNTELSDKILWALEKQAIKLDWVGWKSIILHHNLEKEERVSTSYPDPTLQLPIRLPSIFCNNLLDWSRKSALWAHWKEPEGFGDFVALDFENLQ